MADNLDKINQQIKELSAQLGKKTKVFDTDNLEQAEIYLKGLRSLLKDMSSDLVYIRDAFIDSVNEISKQNTYLTSAKSSLRSISKLASDVTEHRKNENVLSTNQLVKLQHKAKLEFESLDRAIKRGALEGKIGKENVEDLKKALKEKEKFNKALKETLDVEKQINKDIGLLGTGLQGITSLTKKLGFGDLSKPFKDAIEDVKAVKREVLLNNKELEKQREIQEKTKKILDNKFKYKIGAVEKAEKENEEAEIQIKSLEAQNKKLKGKDSRLKSITKSLASQLTTTNLMDFVIGAIVKSIFTLDKEYTQLEKTTLRTREEAQLFRAELTVIAGRSNDVNITTSRLLESYNELNTQLGFIGNFQAKSLETQTRLTKLVGLDASQAAGLVSLSEARGKNAEQEYKSTLGASAQLQRQRGIQLDLKGILAEVGSTTGQVRANLGANPESIARAVTEAKLLGGELKDVEQISKSLLNFQSSIEAELEAELLTGKQLNLERARSAALMGDMETLASEIASQAGDFTEFGKMNVIQQEALAQAFGLSADRLSDMLFKQQVMGRSAQELRDAGEDELANMLEKQNMQEKFNASVEKLQSIFTDIVGAFSPIIDIISAAVEGIAKFSGLAGATVGVMAGLASAAIVSAIAGIYKSLLVIPGGLGIPIAVATTAGLMAAISSGKKEATKVGDIASPAQGQTIVSTKEGGLFELSPNDDLIAAPNLLNNQTATPSNNTEILNAIHNINKRLEEQYNAIKNMKIVLSTNKLETGLVQNAVEIQ